MQEEEDLRVLEWGEGMNGMELQLEASVAFDAEQLVCWLMSLSLFFFRSSTYCLISFFLRMELNVLWMSGIVSNGLN